MEPVQIDVSKLLDLIDKRDNENNLTVRIPIDEYIKLKNSYEEYQTKQYKIDLSVHHHRILEEGGETKVISNLHTNTVSFPDDTHTQLSELFLSVYENSHYVEHLEQKVKQLTAIIALRDDIIAKQKSDMSYISNKKKWWQR